MRKIFIACLMLLGFTNLYSQVNGAQENGATVTENNDTTRVFTIVQQMPKFDGDINQYLANHIQYPDDAKKNSMQGKVYVSFVIERNGSVSTVKVVRGVPGGKMLDNEAVRVVSAMPKWKPGMQNGHTVRVQYMVPISFMLDDNTPAAPAKPKDK